MVSIDNRSQIRVKHPEEQLRWTLQALFAFCPAHRQHTVGIGSVIRILIDRAEKKETTLPQN